MALETLTIMGTLATVLEAIAVTITLIYVIKQTAVTSKNVVEIERELKLTALTSKKSLTQEINLLLIQDPELAQLIGYSKAEMLAFMLLHDCEERYFLWKNSLIGEQDWKSEERVIRKLMNYPFVQRGWQKIKDEYSPQFAEYADKLLPPNSKVSRTKTRIRRKMVEVTLPH